MAKSTGYFGQRLLKNGEKGFLLHLFYMSFCKKAYVRCSMSDFCCNFGASNVLKGIALAIGLRLTVKKVLNKSNLKTIL